MAVEGETKTNKRTGQVATFTQGNWIVGPASKAQSGDASLRGRLAMGMGPMVQAEQTMSDAEKTENPLNKDWGATALDSVGISAGPVQWHPLSPLAKAAGGQDYQDYTQAASAFESQLMPIMSGAAVSPSEAKRQIKAALPAFNDSPETLASKARQRQMMLNGAAKIQGAPLPYPDVPTYGVNSSKLPNAPRPNLSARDLPRKGGGFKYLGPE